MSGEWEGLRSTRPSPLEWTLGALPELLDPEVGVHRAQPIGGIEDPMAIPPTRRAPAPSL